MPTKSISPVVRGNLMNIQEKITSLRPSYPHCLMLQQQIQRAFYLVKENGLPESELLMALFTVIHCKGEGSFDSGVFNKVQREALGLIAGVLGSELVRPA